MEVIDHVDTLHAQLRNASARLLRYLNGYTDGLVGGETQRLIRYFVGNQHPILWEWHGLDTGLGLDIVRVAQDRAILTIGWLEEDTGETASQDDRDQLASYAADEGLRLIRLIDDYNAAVAAYGLYAPTEGL